MSTSTSAPATDDAASYRLPATVVPNAYRLTLTPDLGAASFTGDVAIDVAIMATTTTVVLNAAELDIIAATIVVDGGDSALEATVTLDPTEERAVLTFAEDLPAGQPVEQFIVEQLAADEMTPPPEASAWDRAAT